jgi:hypothetical protein
MGHTWALKKLCSGCVYSCVSSMLETTTNASIPSTGHITCTLQLLPSAMLPYRGSLSTAAPEEAGGSGDAYSSSSLSAGVAGWPGLPPSVRPDAVDAAAKFTYV